MGKASLIVHTKEKSKSKLEIINERFCKWCNRDDAEIIEDYAAGERVCKDCGRVVDDFIIDEHSEWRTFGDKETEGVDPNRVGSAADVAFDGSLVTDLQGASRALSVTHKKALNLTTSQLSLDGIFKDVDKIANMLSLHKVIVDRTQKLLRDASETIKITGKKRPGLAAAAVYIACRQEDAPRTFADCAAPLNVKKKEIGASYKLLLPILDEKLKQVTTGNFMDRFCSKLRLAPAVQRSAMSIANAAVSSGCVGGRCAISVAAAAILMAALLSGVSINAKSVAEAAGVSEGTVRSTLKEMTNNATTIVPANFGDLSSLRNVP